MASWSAWMVPSTSRIRPDRLPPRLAMNADWSSSAAWPDEPLRGEHLVPVVGDPAAGPAVPAAARQPHRVRVGRPEERLGRRGPPVDEQPATGPVGEAEPSDVDGLAAVIADDATQAQVQAVAAQSPETGGQPMDLQVPVHRLLPGAPGRPALGVEAVRQVGDRLLEALRDGREVPLVAVDQGRVGLGGEVVGKVRTRCPSARSPDQLQFAGCGPGSAILRHDGGLAARPPVRYTLIVARGSNPSPLPRLTAGSPCELSRVVRPPADGAVDDRLLSRSGG